MSVGRLMLRGTSGVLFAGHGLQKLTGAFGGHGIDGTTQMFGQIGLHPPKAQAIAAAVTETASGAGLALGYRTPLAASGVVATMLTAINRVHLKNGPWITNQGYEYNLALIAGAVALADVGPGRLSLDALRGKERTGFKSSMTALGLGIAGAAAMHALTEALAPPPAAPAAPATPPPVPVSPPAPAASTPPTPPATPTPPPAKPAKPAPSAKAARPAGTDGSAAVDDGPVDPPEPPPVVSPGD